MAVFSSYHESDAKKQELVSWMLHNIKRNYECMKIVSVFTFRDVLK